jgi:hypothetical protein
MKVSGGGGGESKHQIIEQQGSYEKAISVVTGATEVSHEPVNLTI